MSGCLKLCSEICTSMGVELSADEKLGTAAAISLRGVQFVILFSFSGPFFKPCDLIFFVGDGLGNVFSTLVAWKTALLL
jgi:hypothetical protein